MTLIWAVVGIAVIVLLGLSDPLTAIGSVLANRGLDADQATVLGVVAGLTLPLFLSTLGLTWAALAGHFRSGSPYALLMLIAVVLVGAAVIATEAGLGIPVRVAGGSSSPPALFARAVEAYLSAYGAPLAVSSVALGATAGYHLHRLTR